jgi:hypothetical protein
MEASSANLSYPLTSKMKKYNGKEKENTLLGGLVP